MVGFRSCVTMCGALLMRRPIQPQHSAVPEPNKLTKCRVDPSSELVRPRKVVRVRGVRQFRSKKDRIPMILPCDRMSACRSLPLVFAMGYALFCIDGIRQATGLSKFLCIAVLAALLWEWFAQAAGVVASPLRPTKPEARKHAAKTHA